MRGRHCLLATICVLLLCMLPASADGFLGGLKRLFEDWGLFDGVQLSGQNSLTFQGDTIEGSRAAYEGQRWDTGSIVRRSSLHIEGPIWRNLGVQMDISSSGWGPSYTRYVLGWTTDETALYYGDLNIRLAGNEFASFNKTLTGWQLDQMLPGGGLLRGFYSQERGLTRRQTITGNNTSGPYFLTYTPIVEGSEIVKVDEQVMRFGRDYRLDYETGQLWFEPVDAPPRIIPSTSVISASYQSYGWQSNPGVLYGARAEMPLIDGRMRVGITAVEQDKRESRTASDTAGYQEDIFQASGSTGPFDVNYRPILTNGTTVVYRGERRTIDQPLVVLVDNVEQIEGVDYDSYRQIGRIIFRRAVPPTALVIIHYYYDLGQTQITGDQQVLGLDLGYRINDDLTLRSDYAQSTGGASGAKGSAWRSSLQFSQPRVSAVLELRDIQPGFSYVDSVGFQRNERGLNFAGQWQISDAISLYDRYSDLSSAQGLSFGYSGGYGSYGGIGTFGVQTAQTTTGGLDVKTQRHDLGLEVRYPDWPTLGLSRQTLANSGGTYGNSDQTTDNVSVNWSPYGKPLTVSLNLTDTAQKYLGGASVGSDLYQPRSSDTRQLQTSVTWSPARSLSLSANLGHNTATGTTQEDRSTSDVRQLSLQWSPSDRLSVNLDHTMSESLGTVTSGFYGGSFGGYSGYNDYGGYYGTYGGLSTLQTTPGLPWNPGGGGSSDGDGDEDEGPSRYEDTNTRANISYRPSDTVTLTLSGGRRKYASGGGAGYLADSLQDYYNLSAGWQPGGAWSVSAMVGSDNMKFLEEGRGAVVNDMLAVGVNYRPLDQPWNLALNVHSQTGSSPTYIGFGDRQIMRTVPTDLFDVSGQITYELPDGASLYAQLGRAQFESGYSNFKKDTGEIGVSYRFRDWADVSVGYRFIRNISWEPDLPLPGFSSVTTAGQNYIAHNFMVGVTSSFSSSLGTAGGPAEGLRSFGGYQASMTGLGYGQSMFGGGYGQTGYSSYGTGGFGSYGQTGLTGYGQSAFGQGQYGTGLFDFSSGATRGSSYQYYSSRSGQGFETGLGQFEQPGEDQTMQIGRPPMPGAPQQTGPEETRGDQPPGDQTEDTRRWWEWDE